MELEALIEELVQAYQAKGLVPCTAGGYREHIAQYQCYVNGVPWRDPKTVRVLMARLQSRTGKHREHSTQAAVPCGPSPYSGDAYYRVLRCFFNWLVKENHLPTSPIARADQAPETADSPGHQPPGRGTQIGSGDRPRVRCHLAFSERHRVSGLGEASRIAG